jgi:hypothetical protein
MKWTGASRDDGSNDLAIRRAQESAGVEFIDIYGGGRGRKAPQADAIEGRQGVRPSENLNAPRRSGHDQGFVVNFRLGNARRQFGDPLSFLLGGAGSIAIWLK